MGRSNLIIQAGRCMRVSRPIDNPDWKQERAVLVTPFMTEAEAGCDAAAPSEVSHRGQAGIETGTSRVDFEQIAFRFRCYEALCREFAEKFPARRKHYIARAEQWARDAAVVEKNQILIAGSLELLAQLTDDRESGGTVRSSQGLGPPSDDHDGPGAQRPLRSSSGPQWPDPVL